MVDLTQLVYQCQAEEAPMAQDTVAFRKLTSNKIMEDHMKALISMETNTCDEQIIRNFFTSTEAFTKQMINLEKNDTTQKTLVVI